MCHRAPTFANADVQRHGVALLQIKTTGNKFGVGGKRKGGGEGLKSRWEQHPLGATINLLVPELFFKF